MNVLKFLIISLIVLNKVYSQSQYDQCDVSMQNALIYYNQKEYGLSFQELVDNWDDCGEKESYFDKSIFLFYNFLSLNGVEVMDITDSIPIIERSKVTSISDSQQNLYHNLPKFIQKLEDFFYDQQENNIGFIPKLFLRKKFKIKKKKANELKYNHPKNVVEKIAVYPGKDKNILIEISNLGKVPPKDTSTTKYRFSIIGGYGSNGKLNFGQPSSNIINGIYHELSEYSNRGSFILPLKLENSLIFYYKKRNKSLPVGITYRSWRLKYSKGYLARKESSGEIYTNYIYRKKQRINTIGLKIGSPFRERKDGSFTNYYFEYAMNFTSKTRIGVYDRNFRNSRGGKIATLNQGKDLRKEFFPSISFGMSVGKLNGIFAGLEISYLFNLVDKKNPFENAEFSFKEEDDRLLSISYYIGLNLF